MSPHGLLAHLVAAGVDTPALVIDEAAMSANMAAMAREAERHGVALRPHAKTHKSIAIAKRQFAHGAIGLCVAKLGEAEALAGLSCPILVTAPLVGAKKLARLAALARHRALTLVVDHPDAVGDLSALGAAHGQTFDVLVDLDVGQERTGVTTPAAAAALAARVTAAPNLRLKGVQAYAGHIQHIEDYAQRKTAAEASNAALQDALRACAPHLDGAGTVTGSGTGAYAIDMALGTYTDVQVGSYIFSDVEYDALRHPVAAPRPYRNALFVLTRIVSNNHVDFATVDAGSKSVSMDGPMPVPVAGCPPGTVWTPAGDEFARLTPPAGHSALSRGACVLAVVPHCDPTINMFDRYTVVMASGAVEEWPVDARGRSQ